jgi:hypothetical protein
MTELEAKETIEDLHRTALRDKDLIANRIEDLKEDFKTDPWEATEAQIRRLEDRLVVKGLQAEALAIALTKF